MKINVERQYMPRGSCIVCERRIQTTDILYRIEGSRVTLIHTDCALSLDQESELHTCDICYHRGVTVGLPTRTAFDSYGFGPWFTHCHKQCLEDMLRYIPPLRPSQEAYYDLACIGKLGENKKFFTPEQINRYERNLHHLETLIQIPYCTQVKFGGKFRTEGRVLYLPKFLQRRRDKWVSARLADKEQDPQLRAICNYLVHKAAEVTSRGVNWEKMVERAMNAIRKC